MKVMKSGIVSLIACIFKILGVNKDTRKANVGYSSGRVQLQSGLLGSELVMWRIWKYVCSS